MLISVIIPAYNCASSIERAIDSIKKQTVPVHEIIVVDDGSTDQTIPVIQKLAKSCELIKLVEQPNGGPAKARNTGIENATGDWIAFLDADDVWLPHRIQLQRELLLANPNLAWVAGDFLRVKLLDNDPTQQAMQPISTDVKDNGLEVYDALAFLVSSKALWTGTLLIKKVAFEEAGRFCEQLRVGEDSDLWERLALKFKKIGFVLQPIALYKVDQEASLTGLASRAISPSQYLHYERLMTYIAEAKDSETKALLMEILQSKIDSYMRCFVRTGSMRQAKEFTSTLAKKSLPTPNWKLRIAMLVPPFLVRSVRWIRLRSSRSTLRSVLR